MKATVIKVEDVKGYYFRNDCVGKEYDVIKAEFDPILGDIYTLDTVETIGCVTAWTKDYLKFR